MIKFFRRIRQKLLTENKFSKYLIYTIGEIFLVVIGIMIALQIKYLDLWQLNIAYLANECHVSAGYLSDLLKKETGKTEKDHINEFLIEKAKDLLIVSDDSNSVVAYTLGFNYPLYFRGMFKSKTGMTPQEYQYN